MKLLSSEASVASAGISDKFEAYNFTTHQHSSLPDKLVGLGWMGKVGDRHIKKKKVLGGRGSIPREPDSW